MNDTSKETNLSRKEKERIFKQKGILIAASKVFAEKGFEAATLDEIAEASEYGKGTLYNYFQNKEDIYVALMESILIDYLTILRKISIVENTFKGFMKSIIEELFNYSLTNEKSFLLLIKLRGIPFGESLLRTNNRIKNHIEEINSIYRKLIKSAVESEQIRNIDQDAFLLLYRNMTFSYVYYLKNCKKLQEIDIKTETEFLFNFLFYGIKN